MSGKTAVECSTEPIVTIEEINRVLEVGRLLLSVLTPEEQDLLKQFLSGQVIDDLFTIQLSSKSESEMGNTSVT